MITPEKQTYLRFRHILGFQKSKRYLAWMKEKYPNKDLHHLLGSVKSKKFTDYLVYPFEHNYHINVVEKQKSFYFRKYIGNSISLLQYYAWTELGIQGDAFDHDADNVKYLIEIIHEAENK